MDQFNNDGPLGDWSPEPSPEVCPHLSSIRVSDQSSRCIGILQFLMILTMKVVSLLAGLGMTLATMLLVMTMTCMHLR